MINIVKFYIIFILFGLYFSQCENPSDDVSDFSIQEDYFADHLIGFYLNSIDVNTGDSSVEYFRYRIKQEDSSVNQLEAHYSLVINSSDLNLYNFELISGIVSISNIQIPELVFSNLDINFSTTGIPGADFILQESNMASFSDLEAIQSIILSSGKIPNGTYILNVTLKCSDNDSVIYDSITKTIEAFEPTFLDLVSPGGSIQDTISNTILTTNPLFIWNSDYCSQCDYGIRVCHYDPSLHSSLADAINDNSMLPSNQNLDFYPLPNNQSFSYPTNDAFDLIPGQLYAWQIQRSYQTTLGTQQNKSPIFIFKIYSIDDAIEDSESNDIYADLLEQLLGYQYDQLFGDNGQLKGFSVKGSTILINNETVPITVLYDVINQINNGELEIIEIEVE